MLSTPSRPVGIGNGAEGSTSFKPQNHPDVTKQHQVEVNKQLALPKDAEQALGAPRGRPKPHPPHIPSWIFPIIFALCPTSYRYGEIKAPLIFSTASRAALPSGEY